MSKKYKILIHLGCWLLVFIPLGLMPYVAVMNNKEVIESQFPDFPFQYEDMLRFSILGLMKFGMVFYVFYFLIHKLLNKRNFTYVNLLMSIGVFALLAFIKWYVDYTFVNSDDINTFAVKMGQTRLSDTIAITIITAIQGGLAIGLKTIFAFYDEKKKRKELETSNLQHELNLLRSQVNPHFLFNTLNNIDALISKDPDKASELVIKLSEDMRYILYDANIDTIEISSEIAFLKNYVSLQEVRIRFDEPVIQSVNIDNPDCKIPPMLFLPLVENAFKHGRFKGGGDKIVLNINLKNGFLDFFIQNSYENVKPVSNKTGGLGLNLVKRRFELLFPEKYTFDIKEKDGLFTVSFSINLNHD